jgi:hypothetical protein
MVLLNVCILTHHYTLSQRNVDHDLNFLRRENLESRIKDFA